MRQIKEYLGPETCAESSQGGKVPDLGFSVAPPRRIGRYTIDRELGSGGFGVVYLGRREDAEEPVAIKVLKPHLARALGERFYDEGWLAKSLPSHPNLVRLLNVGNDRQHGPYLVHEFVDGWDLSELDLPVDERDARRYLVDLANALAHLHRHRVIHRDLKPSNIRVLVRRAASSPTDQPVVKLLDLGIAAMLSEDMPGGRRTHPGELLGTPLYMAPEQIQRLPADERTDVYSFGLIAHEILIGRLPFAREVGDPRTQLRRQYQGPTVDRLRGLPAYLQELVVSCLAFERVGRPDSFDEVVRALNLCQSPRIALRAREERMRALLSMFPPPAVARANPYKALHLQRGEVGGQWDFESNLPPYVSRDADAAIDALLGDEDEPCFVLLSGPSKCGKSRSAYEALVRNLPDRALLIPERIEDVKELLEATPHLQVNWPNPVLWLDNLHEHLRMQAIPSSLLRRCLDDGVVVVATIWDSELLALRGIDRPSRRIQDLDTVTLRTAREVLQHASVIRLEATVSERELSQASGLYPEIDFDAGIGETFVARELLLERFDHGSSELKAVLRALVDCMQASLLNGVPLTVLREVFPAYLEEAEPGAWIQSSEVESLLYDALEEGSQPVGVHQRLVVRSRDGSLSVFDPLRYHIQHRGERPSALPDALWDAVMQAPGVNWVAAGLRAWQVGEPQVAERAYRIGMEEGSGPAACCLGLLLENRGEVDEAEKAYRVAIALGDRSAAFNLGLLRGEDAASESFESQGDDSAVEVFVRERGDVTVLEPRGSLTIDRGYLALHEAVHHALERGSSNFLVNLRWISSIDAAGVGGLFGALAAMTQRDKTMRLCSIPPSIRDVLKSAELIAAMPILDDEGQGIESFSS